MIRSAIILIFALLFLISTPSFACDLVYEVRGDDDVSELCVTVEKNTRGTTYRSTFRDVKQLYHYNTQKFIEGFGNMRKAGPTPISRQIVKEMKSSFAGYRTGNR